MVTRRVPAGCCPGCLQEHATEPCPLHRAAPSLVTAAREALAFFEVNDDEDARRVAALLRGALAEADEKHRRQSQSLSDERTARA